MGALLPGCQEQSSPEGRECTRQSIARVFRLPGLPELLFGGASQWGCTGCWPGTGLGAKWVATYARALARPGALSAALAWYRAARPFGLWALWMGADAVCLGLG